MSRYLKKKKKKSLWVFDVFSCEAKFLGHAPLADFNNLIHHDFFCHNEEPVSQMNFAWMDLFVKQYFPQKILLKLSFLIISITAV